MEAQKPERREYPRINKQERREYPRVIVRLETEVTATDKPQISGWTRDLSVKGVFVLCADQLPVGAKCMCRLSLGNIRQGAPIIEVDGKVVRQDENGIAVQFSETAVESFKKFRNFFID